MRLAAARGDIPVIVDVLRFSSAVTTAVANGFRILPADTMATASSLAAVHGAAISGKTGIAQYSLSPLDYLNPRVPEDVILVSPNGAALARQVPTGSEGFVACLLNARTAGRLLARISCRRNTGIVLVAAGEAAEDQEADLEHRRFAIEDYLGCGAILSELPLDLSEEAIVCRRAFMASQQDYRALIGNGVSGKYLSDRGQAYDLSHCVQLNICGVLPVIRDGVIETWTDDR
jgi:2-phosphosulfolactate phosphatase